MLTVIAGTNVFKGTLKNYDFIGDDELILRFELQGESKIECTFPKVPETIRASIKSLKMAKLKNATIDFNKRSISVDSVLEHDGSKKKERPNPKDDSIGKTFLG